MFFGLYRLDQKSAALRKQNIMKEEDEALNMKKGVNGAKNNDDDDDDNLMSSLEKNDLTELHATVSEEAAEQHAKLKAFLESEGLSDHEAQLHDFGIESLRDLEDSHLVNDQTMEVDMGLTEAQMAHIRASLLCMHS